MPVSVIKLLFVAISQGTDYASITRYYRNVCYKTLRKELTAIMKELKETKITLAAPTTNLNYRKLTGKYPVKSLVIPNKLFLLWHCRRALEEKLGQMMSEYTAMANKSLENATLNTFVATLKRKLETENFCFQSRYEKKGGAQHATLAQKCTNILLLENKILSSRSDNANSMETTTVTLASSHSYTDNTQQDSKTALLAVWKLI